MSKAKPKLDYGNAFGELTEKASERNEQRFGASSGMSRAERASQLVTKQPQAFSNGAAPARLNAVSPANGAVLDAEVPLFDPLNYVVGREYRVPVNIIDPNAWGARVYYKATDVDRISTSFDRAEEEGEKQRVNVNGFVKADGRVELIDGGTRLKAAKSTGLPTLRVRIERPPESPREQFKRSKELNEERSPHTALDLAVQYRKLLDHKVYASQDELAADMTDAKGNALSKAQISMYLRIARIPERLQRLMTEHEQTSAFTIAYEISAICSQNDYDAKRDEYDNLAEEVIREVQTGNLGKNQTVALVQSKLQGPRQRTRPEATKVRYAEVQGTLKVFEARGQLDFSIKGLAPNKLEALKASIEEICSASSADS